MREPIAYEEFVNMNKTDSDEPFKVKKGVKSGIVYDPGLQGVEKRLAEKISEINLQFEDGAYNRVNEVSRVLYGQTVSSRLDAGATAARIDGTHMMRSAVSECRLER